MHTPARNHVHTDRALYPDTWLSFPAEADANMSEPQMVERFNVILISVHPIRIDLVVDKL